MKTFLGILSLEDIEELDGPKDVHEDLTLMAYFQIGDMPIGVTIDEKDWILQKAKSFKWKGHHLLIVWKDAQGMIVLYPTHV
jgi:hypothetical protein